MFNLSLGAAFLQQIVLLFHLIVQMVSTMHFVPAATFAKF
jgi:hypothetical protein